MTNLRITGFGKLSLACGSRCVHTFPTRQVEELLGYLLLNQAVAHDREKLIDTLWPARSPVNGRGSLSTVLWRLRNIFRQLGFRACVFIDITRDTVSFAPQCEIQFDVHCFERLLAKARSERSLPDKEAVLEEAVGLYQGELYTSICADWCLVERERLARLHLRTLGRLMYCHMQRESYRQAIDLGDRILGEDPLREEVYRAKMTCYAHLGQRAQVAGEFKQCADKLLTQLAILPSPQTIRTYQKSMQTTIMPGDRHQEQRLQQAFMEFQWASERLNRLLDEAVK